MNLSYKYEIKLSKVQREALEKVFHTCRFLYNNALEQRIYNYKNNKTYVSYLSQANELPEIKKFFEEEFSNIYAQTTQATLKILDKSFKSFFKRVKNKSSFAGFPRFKSKNSFKSITFPQCNMVTGGVKLLDKTGTSKKYRKIKVYGIETPIKMIYHRAFAGKCKTVQIKKESDKYFIILSCTDVPLKHIPKTNKTIGIDLGLNNFITMDDGTKFYRPKTYKTSKEKLAYQSQKLSAKQKDSNNRKKAIKSLQKTYFRINNIRKDFQHKLANNLIRDNDVIIIEKLNISSMILDKNKVAKNENITDSSWGSFAALLKYKAERANKSVIEVDPRNTSRTCSNCGFIKPQLDLCEREYKCQSCYYCLDRDKNAAINIKIKGLGTSLELSKST